MPENRPIRIIKREQRELLAGEQNPECEAKTESQISRDICRTITSWIEDQRETKQELYRRHVLACEAGVSIEPGA